MLPIRHVVCLTPYVVCLTPYGAIIREALIMFKIAPGDFSQPLDDRQEP